MPAELFQAAHLLLVYLHLLATCAALGAILVSDLHVLGKMRRGGGRLLPPEPMVRDVVAWSLLALVVTGGGLVAAGIARDPSYLTGNPKLMAKIVLVALLAVNAVVLHRLTFPRLETKRPLCMTAGDDVVGVAVPAALSTTLWFFAAFLGIARPWNRVMPMENVLGIAGGLFVALLVLAVVLLAMTERRSPARRPGQAAAGATADAVEA
ncbi:MAG TPA: hypothetical protein VFB53_10220 [Burkholderiales bacterium]|nr:hypothetical protein [Burkholderiales bacterium]